MDYYAHSRTTSDGSMQWQYLLDHLQNAAKIAADCLHNCGLGKAAYLAGLAHDCGKFTAEYQAYLKQESNKTRGSVIHSFQGCRLIMERFHDTDRYDRKRAAEMLAYVVGAHHGLFDCVGEGRKIGLKYRTEKQNISYEEAAQAFLKNCIDAEELEELFDKAAAEIGAIVGQMDERYRDDEEFCFEVGMLTRLLLSAVIEGDHRDTAMFMENAEFPVWPEDMRPIWKEQLDFLEEKIAQFPQNTFVEKARHCISEQCKQFAEKPGGIYRLNAPTGSGKTLSALRYALAHAARFNKKRLIFTSPLLTILDQNAKVLREYIGDESLILEHHSNVVQSEQKGDQLDQRELFIESWDKPIIITTLVQLLNNLFAGKISAIRRFHALVDSVIVIDEVQTVPAKLLSMFNLAIQFLSEQCGATIILCSATQPCLEKADHPLLKTPEDMVPYDRALWEAFDRTEIRSLGNKRQEQLPELVRDLMEETKSLLVVCNKKDEAARLLEETKDFAWKSFHLSAAMCMHHRRDTLEKVKEALKKEEKVLCVTTQVIEAGVDISLDCVVRLAAGMDSIVQAAGRCNRNGEHKTRQPVYIVNCTDEKLGRLPDIQRGKDATIALVSAFQNNQEAFDKNLASDAAIAYYYQSLYRSMNGKMQDYCIKEIRTSLLDLLSQNIRYADGDCDGIEDYCLYQAFQTAGKLFSVFDEDTTDVLVPYGKGKELIEELCSEKAEWDISYRQKLLQQAGEYSISLYRYQVEKLQKENALRSICGGCVLVLAEEYYDKSTGLIMEAQDIQTYQEV